MAKKTIYCFDCEQEYTVTTKSKDELRYCVFCASELEDQDADIGDEEHKEWDMD